MAHHSSEPSDDDADIGSTVEQVVLRSACPVASVTRPRPGDMDGRRALVIDDEVHFGTFSECSSKRPGSP